MRSNLEDNLAFDLNFQSGRLGAVEKLLTGDLVLVAEEAILHFYDPGGSTRIITLPEEEPGRFFYIFHTGTLDILVVKTQAAVEVATLYPGQHVQFYCSEEEWRSFGHVYGFAGVGHNTGIVPDPGAVEHDPVDRLFLTEVGWAALGGIFTSDFFKLFYDGTTTLTPTGADTLRLRSSDGTVGIVATANEAVFGDNFNLSVVEGSVDHDTLLNYVADKHVAHAGVSIGTAANSGLSGGGTIASSRALLLDVNNLTGDTPVLGDSFPFYDLSGTDTNKATFTTLNGILDHNSLLNYSANRHIDHSTVSISAGTGLTGGGDIGASRTISLDLNSLNADSIVGGDFIPFWDLSGSDHNKISFANFNATLDHNVLVNYSANRHIDHTSVSIANGAGLLGGGTIDANRTLSVNPGHIPGEPGDGSAASGDVGESDSTTGTSTFTTSGAAQAMVNRTVPAGNFVVLGFAKLHGAGATSSSDWAINITTDSTPTMSSTNSIGGMILQERQAAGTDIMRVLTYPPVAVKLASPTVYYMHGQATFTVSTYSYTAYIAYWRIR